MRCLESDQGAEAESNFSFLLRIRQRRAGSRDPFCNPQYYFKELLT